MNLAKTKALDLAQLTTELQAAGVNVARGLGTFERGPDLVLHTYNAAGDIVETLPPAATAVVNAHTPAPAANYNGGAEDLSGRAKIKQAVDSHLAFLTNATPTNADVVQQVRRLTRVQLEIMRRLVGNG